MIFSEEEEGSGLGRSFDFDDCRLTLFSRLSTFALSGFFGFSHFDSSSRFGLCIVGGLVPAGDFLIVVSACDVEVSNFRGNNWASVAFIDWSILFCAKSNRSIGL